MSLISERLLKPRDLERKMKRKVIAFMKGLHAIPVENAVRFGCPDINYAFGWIELKRLAQWPKKRETCVRFPHFTPPQKVWIKQRVRSGGTVFVLVQIEDIWLLYDGILAAERLGEMTKQDMLEAATMTWWNERSLKKELSPYLREYHRRNFASSEEPASE